jgi:hypothetical protein
MPSVVAWPTSSLSSKDCPCSLGWCDMIRLVSTARILSHSHHGHRRWICAPRMAIGVPQNCIASYIFWCLAVKRFKFNKIDWDNNCFKNCYCEITNHTKLLILHIWINQPCEKLCYQFTTTNACESQVPSLQLNYHEPYCVSSGNWSRLYIQTIAVLRKWHIAYFGEQIILTLITPVGPIFLF